MSDIDVLRRLEIMERINGRVVVCSVSGGKDSTAMALYLSRVLRLPRLRFVFADTGWEHPYTYDFVRGPLTRALGHIDWVSGGSMLDGIARHGMFPSRKVRWCTGDLKTGPIGKYLRALGEPAINAVGIRAEESKKRALQPEWEPADEVYGCDCDVWRPIIHWTEDKVLDIHRTFGVPLNRVYTELAAERCGCWPCINSSKAEIRIVADTTPWRIDQIREMESFVTAKRGAARCFFDASRGAIDPNASPAQPIPIDEVVDWARTGRGGKQFDMFSKAQTQDGCVRWGLCDAPKDTDKEGT